MTSHWLALPTNSAPGTIENPKNLFDTNQNDFMDALTTGVKQQKADMIEREYRMAAYAENSETTRQMRILKSVIPNREPVENDTGGRKPGWLSQVEAPRVSRPGDKDLPVYYPQPEDVGGLVQQSKIRNMAQAAVGGRPAGTSRTKEGDLADGVGVWGSARKAGELYPVFARPSFVFIQEDDMENQITGPNKSRNTASSWRNSEKVRGQRSNDMTVDFTGAPTHASFHSSTGNMAVQPSMTLMSDDTGAYGDKNKAGGVSQTKRGSYERGTTRYSSDAALKVNQKPSFLLVPQGTSARKGSNMFRKDDENLAKGLASRNKATDQNLGPRSRGDTYKFNADAHYAVPIPANTTDQRPSSVKRGYMAVKGYNLQTCAQENGRGLSAGINVHQTSNRQDSQYLQPPSNETLDRKMLTEALGAGHVVQATIARVGPPKDTRHRRDMLNVSENSMTSAQHNQDRLGGSKALDEMTGVLNKQNVRMPQGSNLLGAHSAAMGTAAPQNGEFSLTRNQPMAERKLIRAQDSGVHKRGQDIGFEIHETPGPLSVDMMQHSARQVQPLTSVTDRNGFVPLGAQRTQRVEADMNSRSMGLRTKTTQEMLMLKSGA